MLNFWAGFLVTAVAVAWLYWLWQQRREVTPRPLVVTSNRAVAPVKSTQAEPDDLTVIRGIGPVFAHRLNQAGIYTFSQLATLKPEEVQSITQVTRWDPADWIAEAKSIA